MIVVEPGDSIADLETETCCTRSSDPIFEGLEENNCWYEKLTDTGPEPPYIVPVSAISDSKQSNTVIFTEPVPNTPSGNRMLASNSGKFPQNCPLPHPGGTRWGWPSPPRNGPAADSYGHERGRFSPARPAVFARFLHRVRRCLLDFDGCAIGGFL